MPHTRLLEGRKLMITCRAGRGGSWRSRRGQAAPFPVSNLDDSGTGSLRDAVAGSNATPGADSITFNTGVTGNIVLLTGELVLNDTVTVSGPGADKLTISGSGLGRVFRIPPGVTAAISGLTIADGRIAGGRRRQCRGLRRQRRRRRQLQRGRPDRHGTGGTVVPPPPTAGTAGRTGAPACGTQAR